MCFELSVAVIFPGKNQFFSWQVGSREEHAMKVLIPASSDPAHHFGGSWTSCNLAVRATFLFLWTVVLTPAWVSAPPGRLGGT